MNNHFPTHAPTLEPGTIDAQIVANVIAAIFAMCIGSLFGVALLIQTHSQIQAYMHNIGNNINNAHPYFINMLIALHNIVSFPERAAEYLRSSYGNLKLRIRNLREKDTELPIYKELVRLNLKDLLHPLADIPDHLTCPIGKCLLIDPVLTPAGIIYNRQEIKAWYATHDKDPMTNATLTPAAKKILITNQNKIMQVMQFLLEEAEKRQQPPATTPVEPTLTTPNISNSTDRTSLANQALYRRQQEVGRLFLVRYAQRQTAANQENNGTQTALDPEAGDTPNRDTNRTSLLQRIA